MTSHGVSSKREGEGHLLKELVRALRSDLNMLSNEAKKKFPAVKEVGSLPAMACYSFLYFITLCSAEYRVPYLFDLRRPSKYFLCF